MKIIFGLLVALLLASACEKEIDASDKQRTEAAVQEDEMKAGQNPQESPPIIPIATPSAGLISADTSSLPNLFAVRSAPVGGPSASSGGHRDHEREKSNDNDCCCSLGEAPSYSARMFGSATSVSFDVTGRVPLGILEIGFNEPVDVTRTTCDIVSGHINTRATFPTDPGCQDLNNPLCPRQSTRNFIDATCLEVECSATGNTAWFSGDVLSQDPDPRNTPAEKAQVQEQTLRGVTATYGRIFDARDGEDIRSPLVTFVRILQEGLDNAISPYIIGPYDPSNPAHLAAIRSTSDVSCHDYSSDEICKLKDAAFDFNADFVVVCPDPAYACSIPPNPVGCNVPTPNLNGIGFDPNSVEFACYLEATRIQYLDPTDTFSVGGLLPNTVQNLCDIPAESIYSISGFTRPITSGDISVTRTP